ncbi:MAG: paraquat-inducible protein A [Methylococcales bacterium]|nr:paraquat-inducible protein A [Methylococcales bacterium]
MAANALKQGFVRCHDCGLLISTAEHSASCPRCHSELHARRPQSLQRCAAFLASSFFLYIPANIFPIMTVNQFGAGDPHTIAGGIVELFDSGMIPIGLLVLVASILVPTSKLVGIALLLLCAHFRWQVNARRWTTLYRIIAFVGRWSMLDIFMISILVDLVNFSGVQIIAGPAATAFAAVVILTMFAAENFDPRLLWDHQKAYE